MWPENAAWMTRSSAARSSRIRCSSAKANRTNIARTVAFLIQDAPYVTGQIVAVDGGRSINI